MLKLQTQPDEHGHFGPYGGRYVAETLMPLILEVEQAYQLMRVDPNFRRQFDDLMKSFKAKTDRLAVYAPNFGDGGITIENNLAIADSMGHDFMQHLIIHGSGEDEPSYKTPIKYMVVELTARRQAQLQVKGTSVPEHNKAMNQLTGQPTGPSKSARITYPETQILRSMGMENTLVELLKMRGGDIKGFDAMNRTIATQGEVSLNSIMHLSSGVESTKTLKTLLTCMHLKSTL